MRLTRLTDYALRVLMYAAQHPDRLCTIAEIANAHQISVAHLMKVTHQLGQLGWIITVRGKGGGLRLAHAPEAINLGAVVRDMEPDLHVVECLGDGSTCMLMGNCGLSVMLEGALRQFTDYLDRHTLAEVLLPMSGNKVNVVSWMSSVSSRT